MAHDLLVDDQHATAIYGRIGEKMRSILIFLLFTLVGCTSMTDIRNATVGRHIDQVVRESGPPQQTYQLHGGRMMYVYSIDAGNTSCYTNYYGYTSCGSTNGCRLAFEVDDNGLVRNVSAEGDDCGWYYSK